MADPVAFAEARLAEDKAAAQAAMAGFQTGRWRIGQEGGLFGEREGDDDVYIATSPYGGLAEYGPHIARYDPARVLREVEANRKLLRRHEEDRHRAGQCSNCFDALGEHLAWPCPTLQIVLTIWADHPDYDREWKP